MKPRLAAVALLALATAGCGGEPETNEAAANLSTPTPAPRPTVGARLQAAIRAAFAEDAKGGRRFDDHRLIDTPFGPVLVSYGAVPDADEKVPGIVAIHYLAAAGDGFTIKRAWPEAIRLGSMGLLNGWSVTDKLVDGQVVYAEGTTQAHGIRCGRAQLVELTPAGPRVIAALPTGYEDYGAKDGKGDRIQGRIGEIVKGQGFTMDYAGTRPFAERYVLRAGRFVRESGTSALPNC